MRLLALAFALTSLASAQHVWVDPVQGSNANSGASAAEPYATITFALDQLQVPPHVGERVVHLLPGTYSIASGETFPLIVRKGTKLLGEEGRDVTVLSYPAPPTGSFQFNMIRVAPQPSAEEFVLEGIEFDAGPPPGQTSLTIRALGWQPSVGADQQVVRATDCRFSGVSEGLSGKRVDAIRCEFFGFGLPAVAGAAGIELAGQGTLDSIATVEDCLFDGTYYGILGLKIAPIQMRAEVRRCRFLFCSETAINQSSFGANFDHVLVTDSLFVGSGDADISAQADITLLRSTFVGSGPGSSLVTGSVTVEATDCISVGHGFNTAGPLSNYTRCFIGNPSGMLSNGSITGPDAGFLDPANGDYRLRFGSPCVDAGGPPIGALDLFGSQRRTDGDLNGSVRADIGAHELRTLSAPAEVAIGGTYELQLNGPVGAPYELWFSRTGLVPNQPTPFGRLFLPSTASRLAVGTFPAGPIGIPLTVAPLPVLVGVTRGFQVLVTDPGLPLGGAWTQPVSVTITL